jgi:hypothetical protein
MTKQSNNYHIHVYTACIGTCIFYFSNRIGGVMVGVLALSVVDRGFEPQSDQTEDYKIGICCFSTKHAALRRKSKDWLTRNRDNVSEWGDMFISRLFFQCAEHYKNPTYCVGLVQSRSHHHFIEN